MIRRERPIFYDPGLFDEEVIQRITSVAVLVHTGGLVSRANPSFLFVERLDSPDKLWGLPAGRVEAYEVRPEQTAVRELEEETGLVIEEQSLELFVESPKIAKPEEVALVYHCLVSFSSLLRLGAVKYKEGIWIIERTATSDLETGRLAIIPRELLFHRGHPIASKTVFNWHVMHKVKARLEGLSVI